MISVKVCGMRNPENIREIIDARPDFLGFIFYPGSKRFVGKMTNTGLFEKIPPSISKVGVFVNENRDRILKLANEFHLQFVQLHGKESVEDCNFLKSAGLKIIKSFGVDDAFNFEITESYIKVCDYFLFDSKSVHHGGTGKKFNWAKISEYGFCIPFFLSGGIEPDDVSVLMHFNQTAFFGVDINSKFETEPGVKDIKAVKTFIQKIKGL